MWSEIKLLRHVCITSYSMNHICLISTIPELHWNVCLIIQKWNVLCVIKVYLSCWRWLHQWSENSSLSVFHEEPDKVWARSNTAATQLKLSIIEQFTNTPPVNTHTSPLMVRDGWRMDLCVVCAWKHLKSPVFTWTSLSSWWWFYVTLCLCVCFSWYWTLQSVLILIKH